jgi:hypothetical protein
MYSQPFGGAPIGDLETLVQRGTSLRRRLAATGHFNSQQYQTDTIPLSSSTSDNVIYRLQYIIPNEG